MSEVREPAVETVNIEVDGIPLEVPRNSMIIEATDKAGINIPRFCYHPKLSIAANCRMCLVDVEKAPKPMPACATPVMEGMKVYTQSRRAIDAQHGVMEFLLINHPLDCPICDQGGECELQDLAMGFGRSVSRFTERKRVVKDKNVGPLVQTDMTRCIHCTRCVRFLEEIAGTSEMGGSGRGDRLEIGTCIEHSIDSELSGNIIDLCPVGALTDKPFRFSARSWELLAKPSVGMHDGVGSGLFFHVRRGRVMRAVPRDDEAANEAWLADRDRYGHFGLYAADRVLEPQVKRAGEWQSVDWPAALAAAASALRSAPGEQLGFLMSPSAFTEEYFLAARLAGGLGCANIDHRLRERDFADGKARAQGFGMPIAEIGGADAVLLVGSNIRHEAPIVGHRVREAWRMGARIMAINPLDWRMHFDLHAACIEAPQNMVGELAAVAAAAAERTGVAPDAALAARVGRAEPGETHRAMAAALAEADNGLVLLGQFAMAHHEAAWLRSLCAWLARACGCRLNVLPHGANAAGAVRAGATPGGAEGAAGLDQRAMLESPRQAYLLWDLEPGLDLANPQLARKALDAAGQVVAVAAFAGDSLRSVADVILPLAPWPESEGSMINLDGRSLALESAGRASGECRPGWKILRALGHELGLEGFAQMSLDEVRDELQATLGREPQEAGAPIALPDASEVEGLFRAGEVPMYDVDPLCRRSGPLQQTVHAQSDFVGLNPADAGRIGVADGGTALVEQQGGQAVLAVRVSDAVPAGAVWLRSGTPAAEALGDAVGPVKVSRGQADA